ncbi:MAG TPA: BtpA/SgcQ family protein [Clostridia bacterium]|nr:BtpA/SgcQ family protein [Clostridia bacterium]
MPQPFQLSTVVGIKSLPGTAAYANEPFSAIVDCAVSDALTYYNAGIRNIIIQNVNDWPSREKVGPETVAYMSVIGSEVRNAVGGDCALGISVLRNDGVAAVAIAHAVQAQFIRAKVYVGAMISAAGIETGCMNEVLSLRHAIGSDVNIWADIRSRTGIPITDYPILQECAFAVDKGLCDHMILSSQSFDDSIELVRTVKKAYPKCQVMLGGAVNHQNLQIACSHADGAIVASCLKRDGKMHEVIDPERLQSFMALYQNCIDSPQTSMVNGK